MARHDQIRLLALCALDGVRGAQWQVIAREASSLGGLNRLLAGAVDEKGSAAASLRKSLADKLDSIAQAAEWVALQVDAAEQAGAKLVTVRDPEYPANLKRVPNMPPFLFVLGELAPADIRSIAVVGTRSAKEMGLRQAARMARHLCDRGITVVSGMAAGIDAAAHESAMDAGGRTIAVMGTGILGCYPREHRELKVRIAQHGAVISQFWPHQHGTRQTFPMRNVVTSGISQGTVVIEASETSGAKMQARLAYEHGKAVFVIQSLVTSEPWAREAVASRRAIAVRDVDEIAARLRDESEVIEATRLRDQLAFEFA